MADEIIELLKNDRLRKEVTQTIREVYNYALTLRDNPPDDTPAEDLDENGGMQWYEAWWRAEVYGDARKVREAFQKYVFDKMLKPHRINPEEILTTFDNLSYIDPNEFGSAFDPDNFDFDAFYTVFVNYVDKYLLQHRISAPFPICRVDKDEREFKAFVKGNLSGMQRVLKKYDPDKAQQFPDIDFQSVFDNEKQNILWEKNGIRLRLCGEGLPENYGQTRQCYAIVEGRISEFMLKQIENQMRVHVPSIIWSLFLCETSEDTNNMRRWNTGLPKVDGKILEQKLLIRRLIDAYYSEPTKKDTFDRRIRNAVQLLAQSDDQSNDSVGLALSVTAIEALLGENTTGMTEKLAENVAAILDPEVNNRGDAKEFVKGIYNYRSRTLHGEQIDTESNIRSDARLLAAGVLMSVVSHVDFLIKSGFVPRTPQELLKELKNSLFKKGQPIGVSDFNNVRRLWKKTQAK